jgi:hypothetical protein
LPVLDRHRRHSLTLKATTASELSVLDEVRHWQDLFEPRASFSLRLLRRAGRIRGI